MEINIPLNIYFSDDFVIISKMISEKLFMSKDRNSTLHIIRMHFSLTPQ